MLFEFNLYSGLLLPAVVQGFLFIMLLWWRGFRLERLSDQLLAAIILLYTLRVTNWMLGFAGWYDSHDGYTTFMFYFPFNNWLALGPLIYFFFRSLTNQQFRFQRRDLWHFVPALLDLGISIFIFSYEIVYQHWMQGKELVGHYGTRGQLVNDGLPIISEVSSIAIYASLIVYLFITIRLYRDYRRYIMDHFADSEPINFTWVRNLLYAMILGILIWLLFNLIGEFFQLDFSYIQSWYSYFAWGIIIYYISIEGYFSRSSELSIPLDFNPNKQDTATIIESQPTIEEQLEHQLGEYMKNAKPHLDQELSLRKLATALDTSPTLLSKVINEHHHQNFNEFINTYRVEEMKIKLLDPSLAHLSILGIAFECGFKSKATFNRAFKKHTQLSPSAYMKSQKAKRVSNH